MRVSIWDVGQGGQAQNTLSKLYCRDAVAAIVVFDCNKMESLENASHWKNKLEEVSLLPHGDHIPIVLVGNKSDLTESNSAEVREALNNTAEKLGFIGHFLVSSKTGEGVDDAFDYGIEKGISLARNIKVRPSDYENTSSMFQSSIVKKRISRKLEPNQAEDDGSDTDEAVRIVPKKGMIQRVETG